MKGLIDLYDHNGRKIDLTVLGLVGLKLLIPSPRYRTSTEEVEGKAGVVVIDRTLDVRNLTARFYSEANNYEDSLIQRDKLNAILGANSYFYVSETKNPTRRWKVQLEEWTPERFDRKFHLIEIPLSAPSGSSESINIIDKKFTTTEFEFKNSGDILLDPSEHPEIEIEFKGVSTNLRIVNVTTGEEWTWTGGTLADDVVLLKGARALKNNVSIYGLSNKKIIKLPIGINKFKIYGTIGDFVLKIKSRFYFL